MKMLIVGNNEEIEWRKMKINTFDEYEQERGEKIKDKNQMQVSNAISER